MSKWDVARKVLKIIKVIWTAELFMSKFQYQISTKWKCHQCLELNLLNPRSFLGIPKVYQTKFLHSYLSKQWHRTKVNTSFSSWEELIKDVPQGYVLGPTLFNLYLKLVSAISDQIFIFNQMIPLQKLWKMFFISFKKLFSFLRHSSFCISVFPSFSPCQPLR